MTQKFKNFLVWVGIFCAILFLPLQVIAASAIVIALAVLIAASSDLLEAAEALLEALENDLD